MHNPYNEYETVSWNKTSSSTKRSQGQIARARHDGELVSEKRYGGGQNNKGGGPSARMLDDDELPDFKHREIPGEFKKAMMQARQAKKLTQKQLASMLNVKASVINDYENGKAIPNMQLVRKIEQKLGKKLPKIPKKKKVRDDE